MKKFIIIALIILVVLASGILAGLYIIGDKIIDEALDMSIPTVSNGSDETDQDVPGTTASNAPGRGANTNDDQAAENTGEPPQSIRLSPPSGTEDTAVVPNTFENKDSKTAKEKAQLITVEKMNEIKEQVTAQDKVSAAAMVMSRLSSGEKNKLRGMLSGGLTAEEKAEAKRIAYSHFSSQEITEIKEMYSKYMKK